MKSNRVLFFAHMLVIRALASQDHIEAFARAH
jgi:hypothetical protein